MHAFLLKLGNTLRSSQFWWLGIYLFFCYLMLEITLQYVPWHTDVAFLRIKQDYVVYGYYRWAFFVHVYFSLWVLLAGFTQFSGTLRNKCPSIHRWAGWVYTMVVLLLAAPSGLIIGIYANGGLYSQIAFCALAVLWFYFTMMAMLKIRQRDFAAHQRFMWRSFALTLSAITLRAWKYLIVLAFHPRPMDVYRLVAWLGWVLNLVIIELYILHIQRKRLTNVNQTQQ